ncbi:MAG: nitrous oxide reductase family maturation protein NosD [Bacteroidia bacterium]|nr:nitrous oxide reductase family maturation protein NosD [Bacteroidia bacterium]
MARQFLCLVLLLGCLSAGGQTTWHVGPTQPHTSLANTLARAQPGDSIVVHPGEYCEGNYRITTPRLVLSGRGYPVLDGQGKVEILSVQADSVTIEGFVVRNSAYGSLSDYAGIKLAASRGHTVRNNRLEGTFFGIFLGDVTGAVITGNEVTGTQLEESKSGNGIHLWKCRGIHLEGNTVRGHRDGIYLEFATASTLVGNRSEGNIRYGLHFMFSHDNAYTENTFRNNGAGVAVMYTRNVRMVRNRFEANRGTGAYGLLLKDISDSEVTQNIFEDNTSAIYLEGTNRVRVHENLFRRNGWAVRLLANCADNSFVHNDFIGNTFDVSTNGNLVLNLLSQNYWDKYRGYDLDRDRIGDVGYRPVSLYSVVIERMPFALVLMRSLLVGLLDQTERLIPSLTPTDLIDERPLLVPFGPLTGQEVGA